MLCSLIDAIWYHAKPAARKRRCRPVILLVFAVIALTQISAVAQNTSNLTLLSRIDPVPSPQNEIRYGEVYGCGELALIAGYDFSNESGNVYLYDVSDPQNPAFVSVIESSGSVYDVQIHGRYLYLAAQQESYIDIFDIIDPYNPVLVTHLQPSPAIRPHTFFVAGATMYVADRLSGGMVHFDLTDKSNPVRIYSERVGFGDPHDNTVIQNKIYSAFNFSPAGLLYSDGSDPAEPVEIARVQYPGAGTHNAWPTEDGRYILTTDEIGTTDHNIKIWDTQPPGQLTLVAEYETKPGALVHNVYVRGRYAYMSYYCEGIRIIDIADPLNPVEVAAYDLNGSTPCNRFDSVWGMHPFSNLIYASDMRLGLHIFEFDQHPPANLTGTLTDAKTGGAVPGAFVYFVDEYPTTISDSNGRYEIAWFKDDEVRVAVEATGYRPDTLAVMTSAEAPVAADFTLQPIGLLRLVNVAIDDDDSPPGVGNGNGLLDAVEVYRLRFDLENFGNGDSEGGVLRISSDDSLVDILDSLDTFAGITSGAVINVDSDLRFTLAQETPVDHQFSIDIDFEQPGLETQSQTIALRVQAPVIADLRARNQNSEVVLEWNALSDSEVTGYLVYRRPNGSGDAFEQLTPTAVSESSFVDATVENGRIWDYAVAPAYGEIAGLFGARTTAFSCDDSRRILIVNGIEQERAGDRKTSLYAAVPYSAAWCVDLVDVIDSGQGIPAAYPNLGEVPLTVDLFSQYDALVWLGHDLNDDMPAWLAALPDIKQYLDQGGRVITIIRSATRLTRDSEFFESYLNLGAARLRGVRNITHLSPIRDELQPIELTGINQPAFDLEEFAATDLVEPIFYYNDDPSKIMAIRARQATSSGWNLVLISGQADNYHSVAQRQNITVMLNEWFRLKTTVDEADSESPGGFTLQANYPNPIMMNTGHSPAATRFSFNLPVASHLQATIYNSLGQRVVTLFDGPEHAGHHAIDWTGRTAQGELVRSGLYFFRLSAGNEVLLQKIMVVR